MSLSIITAVHNSLAVNRLYWNCLSENTTSPFQLIIVDNHSTDGSELFFKDLAASDTRVTYLRNEMNRSYPASQNQGMALAKFETLCFLNNDLWLPKGWNEALEKAMSQNPWLVVSPSGQEAQPTQSGSDRLKRRWKRVTLLSRLWQKVLGKSEEERLWKSTEWMYGDLENFQSPTPQLAPGYFSGIKGDSVCFTKTFVKRLNFSWDERIQAADWHLYLTVAAENERDPEVPLPRVLLSSYAHHFGRYSARQEFEPLTIDNPSTPIEAVWTEEQRKRLWWGNRLPE